MPKDQNLKSPNDYPLFGFRVFPETKENMATELASVLKLLNKNLPKNKKPLKKNDVFIRALEIGLNALKQTKGNSYERE